MIVELLFTCPEKLAYNVIKINFNWTKTKHNGEGFELNHGQPHYSKTAVGGKAVSDRQYDKCDQQVRKTQISWRSSLRQRKNEARINLSLGLRDINPRSLNINSCNRRRNINYPVFRS